MFEDTFITWKYQSGDDVVTFEFNNTDMDMQQMFFKWVDFMNAIGYPLDRDEMHDMWHGAKRKNEQQW